MSQRPITAVRPKCEALELREAPASIASQTDYRPLDFQITGTVQTTDVHPSNLTTGQATDTFNGTFTATGRITYDANGGQTGTVQYAAEGNGTSAYVADSRNSPTGNETVSVDYTATETGTLSFRDTNGTWTTTNSFSRTSNRTSETGAERVVLGPSGVKLNFDPSTMTATGGWAASNNGNATSGTLLGEVTQPGAAATDLSVSSIELTHTAEGYDANFSVAVSGALMTPPDKASPAATATVFWTDGSGRTEEAGAAVDVAWNAGKVTADVTGLEAPDWATGVKVAVAANGWDETASLANNDAAADLGSAQEPVDPNAPPPTEPESTVEKRIPVYGLSGPAVIDVTDQQGNLKFKLNPYTDAWRGSISTATGDVNGDGVEDIITGAGDGGGPHVKVFDGKSGEEIASFYAYDPEFRGGVNVAAGDVNGDGFADIVTGAGKGGAPHVKVFDGQSLEEVQSFYAFDAASAAGGVNVAAHDLNGDGKADIITGSGVGNKPEVRVYSGSGDQDMLASFFAYDTVFRTGAEVGTRRLDDGRYAIVTSVDPLYELPERSFDLNGNAIG